MEPESEAALNSLSKMSNVYLAIISGRAADDARDKVKLNSITYAGNHGLEIHIPNKKIIHKIDKKTMQSFDKMDTELKEKVRKRH